MLIDDDQLSKVVPNTVVRRKHCFAVICAVRETIIELQIIAHGTRIGINEKHYFLGIIIFIFNSRASQNTLIDLLFSRA